MKYIFGVIGSIFLFVLLVVLLLSGRSNNSTTAAVAGQLDLNKYINSASSVRFSILGPVTADENFKSQTITLSNSARTATNYKTYQNFIDKTGSYPNNQQAYDSVVRALARSGFVRERTFKDGVVRVDQRGLCAQGYLYQLELLDAGKTIKTLTSNSCDPKVGDFAGSLSEVSKLFRDQIPDYATYSSGFSY
jgi:hypothetical protein